MESVINQLELDNLHLTPELSAKIRQYEGVKEGYLKWTLPKIRTTPEWLKNKEILEWTINAEHEEQGIVFFELFSTKMNIAYINILLNNMTEANNWIESAKNTLAEVTQSVSKSSIKDAEHLQAAETIFLSLKILHWLQFDGTKPTGNMQLLDDKSKGMAKLLEARFIGDLKPDADEELALVEEAMKYDSNWKFYLYKSKVIRWSEKGTNKFNFNRDELEAAEVAYEKNKGHPDVILRSCELVSLMHYLHPVRDVPIRYPFTAFKHRFNGPNDTLTFLREKARFIEECFPEPGFLNALARIFGNELGRFKDLVYAEHLINEALRKAPMSSKINHRKAIFLRDSQRYEEAEKYCRLAIGYDGNNCHAMSELVQLLLRRQNLQPVKEEVMTLLPENYFQVWEPEKMPGSIVDLMFYKGYLLFGTGQKEAARDEWLKWAKVYNIRKPQLKYLRNFDFNNLRFLSNSGWNPNNIGPTLDRIRSEFRNLSGVQGSLLHSILYTPPEPVRANRW